MKEELRSRFRKIIRIGLFALALITVLDVTSIVEFDAFETPRGFALTAGVGPECENEFGLYVEVIASEQVVGGSDRLYNTGGGRAGVTVGILSNSREPGKDCVNGLN